METAASFEVRNAPSSYPTVNIFDSIILGFAAPEQLI
jgi:hypothetical protein